MSRTLRTLSRIVVAVIAVGVTGPAVDATWSIVITDSETKEVAVGTVTCLTSFDLLSLVPVVVVGEGAAAVQAAGDFDGIRRPVIFNGLMSGRSPQEILTLLEGVAGHQQRQYGIADTEGDTISFTGSGNGQWAGSITGTDGTMSYAIQGNVLAGACVLHAIEAAVLNTVGDIPDKLMAGMQAAKDNGGDGRCSCSSAAPTSCGCPPAGYVPGVDKSGHIGGMVVARVGDTDDAVCNAGGCVDGLYFMRLNVPFQAVGAPDPVVQLKALFADWRADLVGRPDAIRSEVVFDPPLVSPNGVSTTAMQIALLDWQGLPVMVPIQSVVVEHATGSAGLSTIGAVTDNGGGTFTVALTSGTEPGVDLLVVTVDDATGTVVLAPDPRFEYFELGDLDGDGTVGITDFLALLAAWGPCPVQCVADLDGDGMVGIVDFLGLLGNWS